MIISITSHNPEISHNVTLFLTLSMVYQILMIMKILQF